MRFARRANHQYSCPYPSRKYSAFAVGQISSTSSRHPAPTRGAYRDRHGRRARDAVDALASRALDARGRTMLKRTAKSCGPDAPMLASSRGCASIQMDRARCPRGDGDNKARSPGRARKKPLKPLRREGRTASAEPVCSCAFCFVHLARETAGAARTRSSLRPLSFRGQAFQQTSGADGSWTRMRARRMTAPATFWMSCARILSDLPHTGNAIEYFTWLSAKLDSIEAMPSSRVSLFFRNAS